MVEELKICPYTGLRPFTEDESIYFKGRDEHIDQATRQLEKNKFIMLTGASGDGKSSLVYAGIIPNAKAGFLKATFSRWSVVDFRPERNPMGNLSTALSNQLGINADTVKTELTYGFSALVDIYKASPLYVDTLSAEWQELDEIKKNEKRRSASNLIILADQFEEFFTNPENFHKGIPSQEAMSVTNLLLETARIALEERLPIYVIITMRSDFIGQCAAFRGLPEYIGFSQFFVPRLNRNELREVIEEPAVLSGNRISRRLTERLIHDIVEGTDQLPILQHALNQIWKMASEGEEQMDLVHYAMVGGMPGAELPDEDKQKFGTWFQSLPLKVQTCYHKPDLKNVLNTHANKLYNLASDHLKENERAKLTDDECQMIIRTAFKCLTKIDNSRAVRNRMTLQEIASIIDTPHITYQLIGKVLDLFRHPGNTLLRPFSDDIPELKANDVLDITHESLIRNWKNLNDWANEEHASYAISVDFGHQLNRWVESKRSSDFLLSVGPLTYFESWIKKSKPNAAWLARYIKDDLEQQDKLAKANVIQSNATEFLKRSARKHRITRTVVRYGAWRIAAVFGAIAVITLSSFLARNYVVQQNAHVLKKIKAASVSIAGNQNVILVTRCALIAEAVMAGQTTLDEVTRHITNPQERVNVSNGVATILVYQGHNKPAKEIIQSLAITDSLLESFPIDEPDMNKVSSAIKEIVDLREVLELAYFYDPSPVIDSLRTRNAERARRYALNIFRKQPREFKGINDLSVLLEHALNYKEFSREEVDELTSILSPFSDIPASAWVNSNYAQEKFSPKGFFAYGFEFNGRYQELGYLYAAAGNVSGALRSVDTMLVHNKNYFLNDYGTAPDNAYHIAACFYIYGHTDKLDEFVKGYCLRKRISEVDFYAALLARCKLYEFASAVTNMNPAYDYNLNLGLEYSTDKQLDFFFSKYREVIKRTMLDENARNFQLALSYKDQAIIHIRKLEVAELDSLADPYKKLFEQAIALYKSIDSDFLNVEQEMVEVSNRDRFVMKRKFLFLYPDIRTPFHPNEPRLFHYFYVSGCFLEYIMKHDLFDKLYKTEEEIRYFQIFMRDYHFVESDLCYTASKAISSDVLAGLEKKLSRVNAVKFANVDLLYLYLGHIAASKGENERVQYYYSKVTPGKIRSLFISSLAPELLFSQIAKGVADLVKADKFEMADGLVKMFNRSDNRTSLYSYAAQELLLQGTKTPGVDRLIDSASTQIIRTTTLDQLPTGRLQLVYAKTMQKPDPNLDELYGTIKNVELKLIGIQLMCRGLAHQGKLFDAYENVPEDVSDADATNFLINILYGYGEHVNDQKADWKQYVTNRNFYLIRPINYVQEAN